MWLESDCIHSIDQKHAASDNKGSMKEKKIPLKPSRRTSVNFELLHKSSSSADIEWRGLNPYLKTKRTFISPRGQKLIKSFQKLTCREIKMLSRQKERKEILDYNRKFHPRQQLRQQ